MRIFGTLPKKLVKQLSITTRSLRSQDITEARQYPPSFYPDVGISTQFPGNNYNFIKQQCLYFRRN
jgi:hypothetical protein